MTEYVHTCDITCSTGCPSLYETNCGVGGPEDKAHAGTFQIMIIIPMCMHMCTFWKYESSCRHRVASRIVHISRDLVSYVS